MGKSERFAHMFDNPIGLIVAWDEMNLCEVA